jgi:hypothetical protein
MTRLIGYLCPADRKVKYFGLDTSRGHESSGVRLFMRNSALITDVLVLSSAILTFTYLFPHARDKVCGFLIVRE